MLNSIEILSKIVEIRRLITQFLAFYFNYKEL